MIEVEVKNKLSYMVLKHAKMMASVNEGFEVPPALTDKQAESLSELEKQAIAMREDLYFYECFIEFDKMWKLFYERKLISRNIPYPEIPYEFIRIAIKAAFDKKEQKAFTEQNIHSIRDYMGDGFFLYFQGILYEHVCDPENEGTKENIRKIITGLTKGADGAVVGSDTGKVYLCDMPWVDAETSMRLQKTIWKVQTSDKYVRLMERLLEAKNGMSDGLKPYVV